MGGRVPEDPQRRTTAPAGREGIVARKPATVIEDEVTRFLHAFEAESRVAKDIVAELLYLARGGQLKDAQISRSLEALRARGVRDESHEASDQ